MALDALRKEAWIEFAIAVAAGLLRLYSRSLLVGVRNLQADDWWMVGALALFITESVNQEYQIRYGTTAEVAPDQRAVVSGQKLENFIRGSKLELVGWFYLVSALWCLKLSMIYFFRRIFSSRWQRNLLTFNIWLCGVTYLASALTILLHCRPLKKLWQVNPDPGEACTTALPQHLSYGVGNMITDALLVVIPIPMIVKMRLSVGKKLMVTVLLCGGIFCMIASLLRMIFSSVIIDVNQAVAWVQRENFIALIVVNAPHIKPLVTKVWHYFTPKEVPSGSPHVTTFGSIAKKKHKGLGTLDRELMESNTNETTSRDLSSTSHSGSRRMEPQNSLIYVDEPKSDLVGEDKV